MINGTKRICVPLSQYDYTDERNSTLSIFFLLYLDYVLAADTDQLCALQVQTIERKKQHTATGKAPGLLLRLLSSSN